MTVAVNGSATSSNGSDSAPEIPKTCKAGVVVNGGPDFTVRVEEVPVPEPGEYIQKLQYLLEWQKKKNPVHGTQDIHQWTLMPIDPGPDEVLLKLNVTGLCYSDFHYMLNDLGTGKMSDCGVRSPGHEGAGVVVKVGSNVTDVKVGDRGGVKPVWGTCGSCRMCWDHRTEMYCPKVKMTGLHCPGMNPEIKNLLL